jgi:YVTN family beta-propeller protein
MNVNFRTTLYAALLVVSASLATIRLQAQLVVCNEDGNTVTLIDPNSYTIIGSITVGAGPNGVAITPNGVHAYVTNTNDGTVSVIDMIARTVITTITVGNDPNTIAITPNGAKAYVTNSDDGTVSVINTGTNMVSTTIVLPITAPDTGSPTPQYVRITPDGSRAYVANEDGVNSYFINTATDVPTAINIGIQAESVAISPNGALAYFGGHLSTNTNTGEVQVVNVPLNTLGALIPVDASPHGVAFTADGATAYTTNEDAGTVSVIDVAASAVKTTISGFSEPSQLAFSPDGSILYVSDTGDVADGDPHGGWDAVIPVYTSTNTWVPVAATRTGPDPEGMALSPLTPNDMTNVPGIFASFFY